MKQIAYSYNFACLIDTNGFGLGNLGAVGDEIMGWAQNRQDPCRWHIPSRDDLGYRLILPVA